MACSGLTITYTGASPTSITYTGCDFCVVTLSLSSGDTYYLTTSSPLSSFSNIVIDENVSPVDILNFSSVCDNTTFRIRGKYGVSPWASSTSFVSGDTFCLDAFDCTSGVTLSGCYTLVNVNSDLGFPEFNYITYPLYSGASVSSCTGTCACSSASPCSEIYCIRYTDSSYDGQYTYAGSYSGYSYWTGDTTPTYYIYNDGDGWCLSDTLGGICLLSGKFPCISQCPDLCDSFFGLGCYTTTTTTSPCNVFDFDALFNCDVPTPSPTPTPTPTPTVTVTPSPTDICSVLRVEIVVVTQTVSPTPTQTPTPTPSPTVTTNCNFSGDVTYTLINGIVDCPRGFQFQDCLNNVMYYTTSSLINPSGGDITEFMIFQALVDGVSKCIAYIGVDINHIGGNNIVLTDGPFGFLNKNECYLCAPEPSPTPTPTPTPTITPTPTMTPTPTSSPAVGWYVYRTCSPTTTIPATADNPLSQAIYSYVALSAPGPTIDVTQSFASFTPPSEKGTCWKYFGFYPTLASFPTANIPTFNYNYFTTSPNMISPIYTNTPTEKACDQCNSSL